MRGGHQPLRTERVQYSLQFLVPLSSLHLRPGDAVGAHVRASWPGPARHVILLRARFRTAGQGMIRNARPHAQAGLRSADSCGVFRLTPAGGSSTWCQWAARARARPCEAGPDGQRRPLVVASYSMFVLVVEFSVGHTLHRTRLASFLVSVSVSVSTTSQGRFCSEGNAAGPLESESAAHQQMEWNGNGTESEVQ